MGRARGLWAIRTVRFEDLLGRHEGGRLSQGEAAEILGVSERTFRRWRERYRDEGPAGPHRIADFPPPSAAEPSELAA